MEIANLERGQEMLHLRYARMTEDQRAEQESRVHNELDELFQWQLTFDDKALVNKADKVGVYLDEVICNYVSDQGNIGRYYRIGAFGDKLLRDEFREALLKAVREREPAYRKERREQIELYVKIATVIVTTLTGLLGAATGLVALLKK
jgi:hypothetical protein